MNIDRCRNDQGKIWLNVASSIYVLDRFVNLDNHPFLRILRIYPLLKPFVGRKYGAIIDEYLAAKTKALLVRHDCRQPLTFPDGSVDHILCSHFLEHVYPKEAATILRDFYRVLTKGGT